MLSNKLIFEDIEIIANSGLSFKKLFGKSVLISGANGYVPSYFVHTFMYLNEKYNANIKVFALCRNEKRALMRFSEYIGRSDFSLIIQDICEPINLEDDINIYIHAASPAGIKKRYDSPVDTFLANVKGADNMLKSAANNPCEIFLYISSVDIYGKISSNNRLSEDSKGYLDTTNVRNVYSCAKRAAESLCTAYSKEYGIPVFIVRPFQILGPGLDLDDGRLHIDFISQILKSNKIVLKSDGSALRSFMYITDAMTAMFTVMLKGSIGEAYNIVTETGEATVKELADIMANSVCDRSIDVVFDYEKRNSIEVTSALSAVTGNSQKLQNLDWKPKFTLKENVCRTMRHYGINCFGF